MEQNYEQNGDLMTDPRIDFAIYQKEGIAIPLTYEQNGSGVYKLYVEESKIVNQKNLNDTLKFCIKTWMPNLVEQGRTIGEKPNVENIVINTIEDKFFTDNPDKILGEMSISDFRNMIIVKGTKKDVIYYFSKLDKTDLNFRASSILENSVVEFNKLSNVDKSDKIEHVKEQLAINDKSVNLLGFGLDADMIEAGKAFLKAVDTVKPQEESNETQQQQIKDAIDALQFMADDGDQDAIEAIEALKLLLD